MFREERKITWHRHAFTHARAPFTILSGEESYTFRMPHRRSLSRNLSQKSTNAGSKRGGDDGPLDGSKRTGTAENRCRGRKEGARKGGCTSIGRLEKPWELCQLEPSPCRPDRAWPVTPLSARCPTAHTTISATTLLARFQCGLMALGVAGAPHASSCD